MRVPITVARPFNNYGPGMRIGDKRLPADFARWVALNLFGRRSQDWVYRYRIDWGPVAAG